MLERKYTSLINAIKRITERNPMNLINESGMSLTLFALETLFFLLASIFQPQHEGLCLHCRILLCWI